MPCEVRRWHLLLCYLSALSYKHLKFGFRAFPCSDFCKSPFLAGVLRCGEEIPRSLKAFYFSCNMDILESRLAKGEKNKANGITGDLILPLRKRKGKESLLWSPRRNLPCKLVSCLKRKQECESWYREATKGREQLNGPEIFPFSATQGITQVLPLLEKTGSENLTGYKILWPQRHPNAVIFIHQAGA